MNISVNWVYQVSFLWIAKEPGGRWSERGKWPTKQQCGRPSQTRCLGPATSKKLSAHLARSFPSSPSPKKNLWIWYTLFQSLSLRSWQYTAKPPLNWATSSSKPPRCPSYQALVGFQNTPVYLSVHLSTSVHPKWLLLLWGLHSTL